MKRFVLMMGSLLTACCVQAQNQITDISPNTAAAGTSDLLLTFTLDSDFPEPPPANLPVDSASIGSVDGTSISRTSRYELTARFDIPANTVSGTQDAVITFTTDQGTLLFTVSGAFTVTGGASASPPTSPKPTISFPACSHRPKKPRCISYFQSCHLKKPFLDFEWGQYGAGIRREIGRYSLSITCDTIRFVVPQASRLPRGRRLRALILRLPSNPKIHRARYENP